MELYEADNGLVNTLKKEGFIETTSIIDKGKGKRSFKLSKNARKTFEIDGGTIRILTSRAIISVPMFEKYELKSVLIFFKLNSTDLKEFGSFRIINFEKIEEKIQYLKSELESCIKFGIQKPRQNKIKRILDCYEAISI
jgi:hypothetical protein